jgi:hypothetical protein
MSDAPKRFVGLDLHKHYVMVGAVNGSRDMILPPRRVRLVEFEGWAKKYLWPTDQVVLEASTNAWYVHDLLQPLVARVVVAHPPHIKLIAAAMVKTDKKARACARVTGLDQPSSSPHSAPDPDQKSPPELAPPSPSCAPGRQAVCRSQPPLVAQPGPEPNRKAQDPPRPVYARPTRATGQRNSH